MLKMVRIVCEAPLLVIAEQKFVFDGDINKSFSSLLSLVPAGSDRDSRAIHGSF